jgi:hypothetical protein
MKFLGCEAPFRWPKRQVSARFPTGDVHAFTAPISYSPFPSGLRLDIKEVDVVPQPELAREVTIVTQRPLDHIRLDFAIPDLRLSEFTAPVAQP